jgi:hypothetical protein
LKTAKKTSKTPPGPILGLRTPKKCPFWPPRSAWFSKEFSEKPARDQVCNKKTPQNDPKTGSPGTLSGDTLPDLKNTSKTLKNSSKTLKTPQKPSKTPQKR